ncbi:Pentatricopeptide repeat-containing protein [Apostasia shenzhenica]|uniref:Pentatricopeptide repeat-containing protein n=1 Tax=Apostasia shenzhenica TaxID=1088818 RepID=A0A2I0B1R3_9ASPA|nr:Pentatricopeptide repeat-containing protein [Apostasia shenzhenica]
MKVSWALYLTRRSSSFVPSLALFVPSQCFSTLAFVAQMTHWDRDPSRLNAILTSHTRAGDPTATILLFQQMHAHGVRLDSYSFSSALSACSNAPALGRLVHGLMLKAGCSSSPISATALLVMYSSSGCIRDARSVFDEMPARDSVAWNALLSSLVSHGLLADAVAAFRLMMGDGVSFTGSTLCSLLKACSALRDIRKGKQIHAWVIVTGSQSLEIGTTFVDFYSNCAEVAAAIEVFSSLGKPKDCAILNALMNVCVQNRLFKEVFALLVKVRPLNCFMLTSALSACSKCLNLLYGRQIHCVIVRNGFNFDAILCNALVNMYSKCGDLRAAHSSFALIERKSVVSWTSIIDAYGSHGRGCEALRLFKMMEEEKNSSNVSPNAATLLSVLTACSHSGLVQEAKECFFSMKDRHDIDPGSEHYACFIDLLGRAGKLEEAWGVFCGLEASCDKLTSAVCVAMLNACKFSMDLLKGEVVAKHLLELDMDNPSNYILVSNFLGAFGRWEAVEELRKEISSRGLRKELGSSQAAS